MSPGQSHIGLTGIWVALSLSCHLSAPHDFLFGSTGLFCDSLVVRLLETSRLARKNIADLIPPAKTFVLLSATLATAFISSFAATHFGTEAETCGAPMDNLWPSPGAFRWESLLDEELLESFHPSLLELESQLNSLPSSWLGDDLNAYETSSYLVDDGDDLTRSSQVDQYCEAYDARSIEDRNTAAASQLRATSSAATDKPQVFIAESSPKPLTDFLHEFQGAPSRTSRRKWRRYSPVRRNEVDRLRKVGACIRCRLTKSSVSFARCIMLLSQLIDPFKCKLDRPCPACIKACGDTKLGKALCSRRRLLDVRFASGK